MKSFIFLTLIAIQGPTVCSGQSIAITVDDVPGRSFAGDCDVQATVSMNRKLLDVFEELGAPATGFVTESAVCASRRDTVLPAVLTEWLDRGFTLGNHTHSHLDLNQVDVATYEQDIVAGERTTSRLLEDRGERLRYFRYPMLHAGDTEQKKAEVASFLNERGYTNAPVTIDSQEWLFASAYANALAAENSTTAECIADAYIPFMESVVAFFENWSIEVLGYQPPHILLLHANDLNADHGYELLTVLQQRGYRFTSLEEALADPVYSREDGYVGTRGLSWIHRWALDAGMLMKAEPREPGWLQDPSEYCQTDPTPADG